jgi:hypothetical protein
VGYDLLNEPQKGNLGGADATFVTSYLNPFYQKAIDRLRAIDQRHIAFFQPGFAPGPVNYLPYVTTIDRPNVSYAPHFYPNWRSYELKHDFSVTAYDTILNRYLAEGASSGVPVMVGEYGLPWNPADDGNADLEASYQVLEKAAINRFIGSGLSFTRPWYADDRSGAQIGPYLVGMALIRGRSGLGGPLRTFITDVFTSAVTNNRPVA